MWDGEEEFVSEGHVWQNTMHLTTALWREMVAQWGSAIYAVRTAADPVTGEVMVALAEPGSPHAESVRLIPGQGAAEFSFLRALRKLGVKVPAGQALVVKPECRTLEGIGPVFVFPMARRRLVPRASRESKS